MEALSNHAVVMTVTNRGSKSVVTTGDNFGKAYTVPSGTRFHMKLWKIMVFTGKTDYQWPFQWLC